MADINNAEILFVGEIQKGDKGKKLVIDVSTSSMPKTRFLIMENTFKPVYDLVKHFESKKYDVGSKISFYYNSEKIWSYPLIWRIEN